MTKALDLTGQKHGKLTVISRAENNRHGKSQWNCVCECGNTTKSVGSNLLNGKSITCGCGQKEAAAKVWKTHGLSKTVEYTRQKNRDAYHRRKKDPIYASSIRVRLLIRHSLGKRSVSKTEPASKILGCTYEQFRAHIERQFTDGMSWDRFDEIHIDHIIPLASAKTPEEVKGLCHFTNLRPLWAIDNLKKNGKREFLI
jgi:hypothetical protein